MMYGPNGHSSRGNTRIRETPAWPRRLGQKTGHNAVSNGP